MISVDEERPLMLPAPAQVYFGPTRNQHLGLVLGFPLGALLGVVVAAALGQGPGWITTLAVTLGTGIGGGVARLALAGRQGLTVNAYGVLVRRGYRETQVPWSQVRDVQVRHTMGVQSVRLVTAGAIIGTGYPCSHPLGRDPEFQAKVEGIRRWWEASRRLAR